MSQGAESLVNIVFVLRTHCMHFLNFQITVTSGVCASIDLMAHALADQGG